MQIKIIGSNCSNGIKLKKSVNKVKDEFEASLEIVDDLSEIKKHNIKNIPALIINDIKVSEGKVLTEREIIKYLKLCNN